jgi:hypothetical protein
MESKINNTTINNTPINNNTISEYQLDSVVSGVITKYIMRAELGMKKYGTNLDRKDLQVGDWIKHVQEELMDAVLYLEKLSQEVKSLNIEIKLQKEQKEFDGDMLNLNSK